MFVPPARPQTQDRQLNATTAARRPRLSLIADHDIHRSHYAQFGARPHASPTSSSTTTRRRFTPPRAPTPSIGCSPSRSAPLPRRPDFAQTSAPCSSMRCGGTLGRRRHRLDRRHRLSDRCRAQGYPPAPCDYACPFCCRPRQPRAADTARTTSTTPSSCSAVCFGHAENSTATTSASMSTYKACPQ